MFEYEIFDFNALITERDRIAICGSVRDLIEKGNFWTNSPKYQTNVNVMGLPDEHWMKIKMSFIYSCFAFLKREVQIKTIQSWSYKTSLKHIEDRDTLWHHHNHNLATRTVSGIFYVDLPKDLPNFEQAGTEFAPLGVEARDRVWIAPQIGKWLIYPGKTWHRPGILQSHQDRFIVAADLEF